MKNPQAHRHPDVIMTDVVDALNHMRDAMLKASLMLKDLQFDLASAQRAAAVEHSKELIEKVKAP